jgi:hypothetical protein
MKEEFASFRPRDWAMENISPKVTTAKLKLVLDSAEPTARTTTGSLLVKVNAPEVRYWDEDRFPRPEVVSGLVLRAFRKGKVDRKGIAEALQRVRTALEPGRGEEPVSP